MGFEFQRSRMCHSQTERETVWKTRELAAFPARSAVRGLFPARALGPCAVLQKASEDVAECLRRAADAEACADDTNDPTGKAEYQTDYRKLADFGPWL